MTSLVKAVTYTQRNRVVLHELYENASFVIFPAKFQSGALVVDTAAVESGAADLTLARAPTVARDFAVANYWTLLMRDTVLPASGLDVSFKAGRFPRYPTPLAQWRDYVDRSDDMLSFPGLTPTDVPADGYRRTYHLITRPPHPSWTSRTVHIWVTASTRSVADKLDIGLATAQLENLWTQVTLGIDEDTVSLTAQEPFKPTKLL
jgi:hypothetical protein